MSTITYNGTQILAGQPVPFVGREDSFIRYGDRWGDKTTITLHGQLTGCTFAELISAQNALLSVFSEDFKTLDIDSVFTASFVMIRGISFASSSYAYGLRYTITLDCYQEDLFLIAYGVLDPVDEWSFDERPDNVIVLTHTISARGFVTSSSANALTNAKNFVSARTGLGNIVTPIFVGGTTSDFCLKSQHENINRFTGTYSIEETYVEDAYYEASGLYRYSTTFDCNTLEGLARVTVEGNIDGCGRASDMNTIRDFYNAIDFYTIANDVFTAAGGGGTLNTGYVSNAVTEDTFNKKITFSRVYDNNPDDLVYLDYTTTASISENEVATIVFTGVVKGRGDINTRWTQVQAFYNTLDVYPYALAAYNALGIPYPLNSVPTNESVSFNQFQAEITINKTWDNKLLPPAGFKNFTFTMHFTPSIRKVSANPLSDICGQNPVDEWYVVDLGYNTRCAFSVNGNGLVCSPNSIPDAIVAVRLVGNALFSTYCPIGSAVLERKDIGYTTDVVRFEFGWSAVSPFPVDAPPNYQTVSQLKLK